MPARNFAGKLHLAPSAALMLISLTQPAAAIAATGTITRVSVDSNGNQAISDGGPGRGSGTPLISADGRYVAFSSRSSNLAGVDSSFFLFPDIYLHDRLTGVTSRISDDANGKRAYANGGLSLSADGRFVAFSPSLGEAVGCDKGAIFGLVVHDNQTGQKTCIPKATGALYSALSADGRYVAFSGASGLVTDDTNGISDVFVHDLQTGVTRRVSVDSAGNQAAKTAYSVLGSTYPSISADGRYVVFESAAGDFVAEDLNNRDDIFVHDTQTGVTSLISVSSSGIQGNSHSERPSMSADGRYIAFDSDAYNLVPGRSSNFRDVYVHDRQTHETTRVSVDSAGKLANRSSEAPRSRLTDATSHLHPRQRTLRP